MSKAKKNYVLAVDKDVIRMVHDDDIRLETLESIPGKFIKNKGEDIPNSKEVREIGRFIDNDGVEYIVFSNKIAQEVLCY